MATFNGPLCSTDNFNGDSTTSTTNFLLSTKGDTIRICTLATPASNANGDVGEIRIDTGFIYVCTATNTWKRVALTGGY